MEATVRCPGWIYAPTGRIFSIPTPVDEAFAYLKALRAQPSHAMLAELRA